MPITSTSSLTGDKFTTCVVGGGNAAHVIIPFLSLAGHVVRLLTLTDEVTRWKRQVYCDLLDSKDGNKITEFVGDLHAVSDKPGDVIPGADCVILCMPVHQYRPALNNLARFLDPRKTIYLGTIYGQGGFNWMVHHDVEQQYGLLNIVTFAIGSIPWICRTTTYGSKAANYGGKDVNLVAVSPRDEFENLNRRVLMDISEKPLSTGKFHLADSFLSLTLSVDNQIIHPARCYGLWLEAEHGKWSSLEKVPLFYRGR